MTGGLMGYGVLGYGGTVRNLDVQPGEAGTLEASFAWDGQTDGWRWWGYLDGSATAECSPGSPFVSDPLVEGFHDLRIIPWEEWVTPIPEVWGNLSGRQVYLDWTAVAASDARAYNVYWDNGTGTVDDDTPLATLDLIEAQGLTGGDRPRSALPTSGTGTGLLTIGGTYSGAAINAAWKVKVTGASTFQLDTGGGYGGNRDWLPFTPIALGSGLSATFESAAAVYDTNDVWEFLVGPRTWWVSGELVSDSYKFAVAAVDAAGNESSLSTEQTVVVDGGPEPVEDAAIAYNAIAETITITWTDPASLDDVVIYSNWNAVLEELEEFILEDGPLAVVADTVETYTLTLPTGTEGDFLFYVRAREGGLEDGSASILRVTAAADVEPDLTAPTVSSAVPGAGGVLVVTAAVDLRGGVPTHLAFYVFDALPVDWSSATPDAVVAFAGTGFPIALQAWTSGVETGTKYVAVRARDVSANETSNTEVTAVTADATAPSAPTIIAAVAT